MTVEHQLQEALYDDFLPLWRAAFVRLLNAGLAYKQAHQSNQRVEPAFNHLEYCAQSLYQLEEEWSPLGCAVSPNDLPELYQRLREAALRYARARSKIGTSISWEDWTKEITASMDALFAGAAMSL